MRFVSFYLRKCAGRAALALASPLLMAGVALAGGKPEKIEFSDPATPITYSNLSRLAPNKSFSDQIKEDLFKPFDSLKQGNSLDPVMPEFQQPRQQQAPDRRQRELMDQRKNWAFIDSSDLLPKSSIEDMLQVKEYGPDGREKKDPSAIDKYYERLGKRQGPTALELSEQPGAGRNRDFAGTNAFNSSRFANSTNESTWTLPSSESETSQSPWAVNGATNSQEQLLREKQHRSDFNSLLEGRVTSPIAAPSPFGVPAGPATGMFDGPATASAFGNAAQSRPESPVAPAPRLEYQNSASPMLGAVAQPLITRPHALDDPTLHALGLPQPAVKLADTPKPVAPTMERAAEFSLPQRKF